MATAFYQTGKSNDAERQITSAFEGGLDGSAVYLGRLQLLSGHIAFLQKRFSDVTESIKKAKNLFEKLNNKDDYVRTLFLQGRIEKNLAYSIKIYLEALDISRKTSNIYLQREALLFISLNYIKMEDGKSALIYLNEGLLLAREPQDPHIETMFYIYLSYANWLIGNLDKSLKFGYLAENYSDKAQEPYNRIWSRINIASIRLEIGDLSDGKMVLQTVSRLKKDFKLPEIEFEYVLVLSKLYLMEGNLKEAIKKLNKILNSNTPVSQKDREIALCILSECYFANKEFTNAKSIISQTFNFQYTKVYSLTIKLLIEVAENERSFTTINALQDHLDINLGIGSLRLKAIFALVLHSYSPVETTRFVDAYKKFYQEIAMKRTAIPVDYQTHFIQCWNNWIGKITQLGFKDASKFSLLNSFEATAKLEVSHE